MKGDFLPVVKLNLLAESWESTDVRKKMFANVRAEHIANSKGFNKYKKVKCVFGWLLQISVWDLFFDRILFDGS